jgi:hypothetical protein
LAARYDVLPLQRRRQAVLLVPHFAVGRSCSRRCSRSCSTALVLLLGVAAAVSRTRSAIVAAPHEQVDDRGAERVSVHTVLAIAVLSTAIIVGDWTTGGQHGASSTFRPSGGVRLVVGAIPAGVVGTGLYPILVRACGAGTSVRWPRSSVSADARAFRSACMTTCAAAATARRTARWASTSVHMPGTSELHARGVRRLRHVRVRPRAACCDSGGRGGEEALRGPASTSDYLASTSCVSTTGVSFTPRTDGRTARRTA